MKAALAIVLALALLAACTTTQTTVNSTQNSTLDVGKEVPPTSVQEVREFSVSMGNFYIEPAEIRVKQGEKVRLIITAVEGNHGIGIDGYGQTEEIAEGETKTIEFTADKSGEFRMFCNVFCGQGHRDMKGRLIVE